MKMNFKYVMLAAAMLVGFASCNKDEVNGPGSVEGKKTYASITLSQSQKTYAPTYDEAATSPSESTITSVDLLFFNGQKVLEKVYTFTAEQITAKAANNIETTAGEHYIYAVINKPAGFALPTVGTNMYVAEKKIVDVFAEGGMSYITTDQKFFMTNEVRPTAENFIEFNDGDPMPGDNKIKIYVGRAMAKVSVKYVYADVVQPAGVGTFGQTGAVQFLMAGNPKEMYLFPVTRISPETTFIGYRGTPYFTKNSGAADVVTSDYFPNLDDDAVVAALTYSAADGTATAYTMENSNALPRHGNATYALIKGKFAPAAATVWNAAGDAAGTLNAAGDFWRVQYKYNGVVAYLPKVYDAVPTNATANVETALSLAPGTILPADVKLVKYTDGICYYGLWLADNTEQDLITKRTVARNYFFKANITEITGIGANTPGGVTGDEDDENDDDDELDRMVKINADIEILPWRVVEFNGIPM